MCLFFDSHFDFTNRLMHFTLGAYLKCYSLSKKYIVRYSNCSTALLVQHS